MTKLLLLDLVQQNEDFCSTFAETFGVMCLLVNNGEASVIEDQLERPAHEEKRYVKLQCYIAAQLLRKWKEISRRYDFFSREKLAYVHFL